MTKTVRVNVRHAIDNTSIRRERRDGRDYIVVPSATMPDGIVMNKIRYSADEIAKAFSTLENTPAPLGHPTIEGAFVSAKDPEGLARGWIGAWNRNVRRENGRVFIDKVIDVATANQLDGGKTVLAAIEKGEAIHSSTGLYAILTAVQNDGAVDWEASDIVFDHDAILIGEDGAATPAQGVGLMVNGATNPDAEGKIDVINSMIEDDIERDQMWALESLLRVAERKERLPLLERMKAAIDTIIRGSPEPETVANQETSPMDKEQFDALSGKVEALTNAVAARSEDSRKMVAELIGEALKPVIEAQEAIANAAKAKDEAEHAALVNQVVEAKLLDEATAKATPAATLTVLANSLIQTPKVAFRVNAKMADAGKTDIVSLAPKGD